jgi:hypothetical protein
VKVLNTVVLAAEPIRYPPQVIICCIIAGAVFGVVWGITRISHRQAPTELLMLGAIVAYLVAYRVGILWEYGKDYLNDELPLIVHAGALVTMAWLGRLAVREIWGKLKHEGVENE